MDDAAKARQVRAMIEPLVVEARAPSKGKRNRTERKPKRFRIGKRNGFRKKAPAAADGCATVEQPLSNGGATVVQPLAPLFPEDGGTDS